MREPTVACLFFVYFLLCSSIYYFRGAPKFPKSKSAIRKSAIRKSAIRKSAIRKSHRFPPIEGLPGGVKTKNQSKRSRYDEVGTRKTNQEQIGDFGITCEKKKKSRNKNAERKPTLTKRLQKKKKKRQAVTFPETHTQTTRIRSNTARRSPS